jgi:hypothetical protein
MLVSDKSSIHKGVCVSPGETMSSTARKVDEAVHRDILGRSWPGATPPRLSSRAVTCLVELRLLGTPNGILSRKADAAIVLKGRLLAKAPRLAVLVSGQEGQQPRAQSVEESARALLTAPINDEAGNGLCR